MQAFNPDDAQPLDYNALRRVINAMRRGDIGDCQNKDVRYCADLLANLHDLDILGGGQVRPMLDLLLDHFGKKWNRSVIGEMAQERANKEGFGEEWRKAIDATLDPRRKDLKLYMVEMVMKAENCTRAEATRQVAAALDRKEGSGDRYESVKRSVTRSRTQLRKSKK